MRAGHRRGGRIGKIPGGEEFGPVVHDVHTVLPGGKVSVILGGSGCGKSTLLRNILGLIPLKSGRIILGGRDLSRLGAAESLEVRRHMVGISALATGTSSTFLMP